MTQATSTDPLPALAPELSVARPLERLQQQAEEFVRAAKAASTLRAYRSDWEHFRSWCEQHVLCPLPASPETVALYLAALAATHRPATKSHPDKDGKNEKKDKKDKRDKRDK